VTLLVPLVVAAVVWTMAVVTIAGGFLAFFYLN